MEAKDLKLQLEQTLTKEETTLVACKEPSKSAKAKVSRSKSRRSPYPVSTSSQSETTEQMYDHPPQPVESQPHKPENGYFSCTPTPESSSDIGHFIWYNNTHSYPHPHPVYGDPLGMYSYGSAQKYYEDMAGYGMSCEDKFFTRDTREAMNLYANYYNNTANSFYNTPDGVRNIESPSATDPSSKRQSECGSVDSDYQFEPCAQASRQSCAQAQSTLPLRNDLGISGALVDSPVIQTSSSDNSPTDCLQQQHQQEHPSCSKTQNNSISGRSSCLTKQSNVELSLPSCKKDKETSYTNMAETKSCHQNSIQQSVIKKRSLPERPCALAGHEDDMDEDHLYSDTREKAGDAGCATDLNSCASVYDTYGRYKYCANPSMMESCMNYPIMTQPGYTSVIVDAQQYHLTNGVVH